MEEIIRQYGVNIAIFCFIIAGVSHLVGYHLEELKIFLGLYPIDIDEEMEEDK